MTLSEAPVTARTAARPQAHPLPQRHRRGGGSLTHTARTAWLLVGPALGFVIVFVLTPLAFAVYISLTNWPLIGDYDFVGLANYEAILQDTASTLR